jgi:hypothetical protein
MRPFSKHKPIRINNKNQRVIDRAQLLLRKNANAGFMVYTSVKYNFRAFKVWPQMNQPFINALMIILRKNEAEWTNLS